MMSHAPAEMVERIFAGVDYKSENPHLEAIIETMIVVSLQITLLGYYAGTLIVPFNISAAFAILVLGIFWTEILFIIALIYKLFRRLRKWRR